MQLMLAENIRMFRKQRKLTQEKLAEAPPACLILRKHCATG